jgi:hypothetical protein
MTDTRKLSWEPINPRRPRECEPRRVTFWFA